MGGHCAHSGLAMCPGHGDGIGVTGDDTKDLGALVYGITAIHEEVKEDAFLRDGRGIDYQHPVIFRRLREEYGERVDAVFIGYGAALLNEGIGQRALRAVITAYNVTLREEVACQCTHSYPPYPEEIYPFYVCQSPHLLICLGTCSSANRDSVFLC